jgi:hypothetical protein
VKTNLKNILKLNKIVHSNQNTEITPRIIKTAGTGSIRQKRTQVSSVGESFGNPGSLAVDGKEIPLHLGIAEYKLDTRESEKLKPRLVEKGTY